MTPDEKLRRNIILGTIGYGAALLLGTAAGVRRAKAHDWYDPECCSTHDCAPISGVRDGVPWSEVRQTDEGYEWRSSKTGQTHKFPYGSPNVRPSRDGYYHGCEIPAGFENQPVGRCIYVPTFF